MGKIVITNGKQLLDFFYNLEIRMNFINNRQFLSLIHTVSELLLHEKPSKRPRDDEEKPGGIVILNRSIETLIVPDIHGRVGLITTLLDSRLHNGKRTVELLDEGKIQIVFVGDGMHGERRVIDRWKRAYNEFTNGYIEHTAMDEEMHESFTVMKMIMMLKLQYPSLVHYLKGNHDNILNTHGNGNYPFMKYACEGPMVTEYIRKFHGLELLNRYSEFESCLPLFAMGKNFLVSHAEPAAFYTPLELINHRKYPEIIEGLTWTDNGSSAPGTVELMIDQYIRPEYKRYAYYFGGHRPVDKLYRIQSGGRYIQIHNPDKYIAAHIKEGRCINLNEDIIELQPGPELPAREAI